MTKITSPRGSIQLNAFTVAGGRDPGTGCPSCGARARAKAFMVTDDGDLVDMLKYALDCYDLEPLFCQGCAEALAYAAIDPFDYVIVDCDTPGMNVIDAVRWLRERFVCAVIIGLGKEDRGAAYLQAGMTDFLQKPFVPYRLAMMLDGGDILS